MALYHADILQPGIVLYEEDSMARLEEMVPSKQVRGILPNGVVTIIRVQSHGSDAVGIVYTDGEGQLGQQLLFRHAEANFEIADQELPWRFDGDGALFRLISDLMRSPSPTSAGTETEWRADWTRGSCLATISGESLHAIGRRDCAEI